ADAGGELGALRRRRLLLQIRELAFQLLETGRGLLRLERDVLRRAPQDRRRARELLLLLVHESDRFGPRQRDDAAHSRRDRAFALDLEEADVSRAGDVRSTAELDGGTDLQDPDAGELRVLVPEE